MGKEIVYCHVCGDRILQADFESGRAAVVLEKNYCRKCSSAIKKGSSSTPLIIGPATPQAGARQTRRISVAKRKGSISRNHLIMIMALGAFLLLILLVFALSRPGLR